MKKDKTIFYVISLHCYISLASDSCPCKLGAGDDGGVISLTEVNLLIYYVFHPLNVSLKTFSDESRSQTRYDMIMTRTCEKGLSFI